MEAADPRVPDKYTERALKRRRGAGTHRVQTRELDILPNFVQTTPRTRAQSRNEGVSPTINLKYGTGQTTIRMTSLSPMNQTKKLTPSSLKSVNASPLSGNINVASTSNQLQEVTTTPLRKSRSLSHNVSSSESRPIPMTSVAVSARQQKTPTSTSRLELSNGTARKLSTPAESARKFMAATSSSEHLQSSSRLKESRNKGKAPAESPSTAKRSRVKGKAADTSPSSPKQSHLRKGKEPAASPSPPKRRQVNGKASAASPPLPKQKRGRKGKEPAVSPLPPKRRRVNGKTSAASPPPPKQQRRRKGKQPAASPSPPKRRRIKGKAPASIRYIVQEEPTTVIPKVNRRHHEPSPDSEISEDEAEDSGTKMKAITAYKMSTDDTVQVNPVDVVNSEISDIIKTYMSQIEDGTIRRVVGAFRDQLSTRLIEQSDLVNESVLLDSSIRKARQEKKSLRTELVAVQKERDKIRLALEAAQKNYDLKTEQRRKMNDVNQFLIDLEVSRNEFESGNLDDSFEDDQSQANVLALLAQVTPRLSNGGVLSQLRRFNTLLEQLDDRIQNV